MKEFMFRKIRNIGNLGNVHIRGPSQSRTDAQNGLDFYFKFQIWSKDESWIKTFIYQPLTLPREVSLHSL